MSWNKSLRYLIQKCHEEWLWKESYSFTKSRIPIPPMFLDFVGWLDKAWPKIPVDEFKSSMKLCGMTTSTNIDENHLSECLRSLNSYHYGNGNIKFQGCSFRNFISVYMSLFG